MRLARKGDWYTLAAQEVAASLVLGGVVVHAVPAGEYADRREIQSLGLPELELAWMTIDQVADRIHFLWERTETA